MTSSITVRIDSDLKKEADELFADLGMNLSTAINLFVHQSVRRQKLPFAVSRLRPRIPNAETLAAIEEADRLIRDPNTPRYKTTEELIKALEA